jgi:hypothetical protein
MHQVNLAGSCPVVRRPGKEGRNYGGLGISRFGGDLHYREEVRRQEPSYGQRTIAWSFQLTRGGSTGSSLVTVAEAGGP